MVNKLKLLILNSNIYSFLLLVSICSPLLSISLYIILRELLLSASNFVKALKRTKHNCSDNLDVKNLSKRT
jgi:hypothetical protein